MKPTDTDRAHRLARARHLAPYRWTVAPGYEEQREQEIQDIIDRYYDAFARLPPSPWQMGYAIGKLSRAVPWYLLPIRWWLKRQLRNLIQQETGKR